MQAEARIPTDKASSYIKKLCHHFKMKVPAEYDETRGHVQFPFGACEMLARPDELVLRVRADSSEEFERVKSVVGGHLEMFTTRAAHGEPITVQWYNIL